MRIAKRGISNEQALLFSRPGGKFLRAKLSEKLARSCRSRDTASHRNNRRIESLWGRLSFHFGVAVEDDVADIGEKLGGAIPATGKTEQFRRLVEKGRRDFPGTKLRMVDDVLDERDIRLHSSNTELAKGAVHALAGLGEVCTPCSDFDKQRVIVGSEHRTRVCGAAIQPNPKS